ncbi:unnamed protein product [Ceratitis capitata]|uniref:(Mediterranean fruit fly) hypothetical protein n=1 Tax=Ceratitis capitata TaxID=7213 RepID=A0A811V185_CERCA|nr:unnamed protein product [Ceratitis capitata]
MLGASNYLGGPSRAQWEDVTGSTPLTFVNDCVSFTTTVSARFWLMDCRNISEATKMATELYKEVIHVPFMAKFVVFAKKVEPYEARLRVFCMTDDREDKTLEKQELFTEVAKSRDVEVLEGKPQFIEMAGNLVPVTKSGDQLQLPFKAFRENRLPFTVRVKDQHADIVGRTLFMKEPKVAKGEPPQHPICILNIVLPEIVIPDTTTEFSDKITTAYRSSLYSLSKHQNDHYIGDIRIVDLSNLLGKDWIQLASEIGISTEEIDEIINQNTDSIARQAQSMIRLYKDKPNYDIHALEAALKNIGRDDIMKKCKSGRLSHSRDFDETDIMKNSESVEELVRQESKRIQQIHDHEEVKYSAEEKDVEESESDEEITKRTVAERREKIVKRLSIERQIPASTQKKEISREISEIKRKSLIEDKKAIHESEIMMQLPTDNIVKSTVAPDQVMKMKMGKMDSAEISKSDFDKELTHKLKTSGRSSEEEDSTPDSKDDENTKIVKDISAVEKSKKTQYSPITTEQDATKQLTEDFLNAEKQTQLPVDVTISEKFVEEVKEKEMKISEAVEKSSQKVEKIISVFESGKQEEDVQTDKDSTSSKTSVTTETIQTISDEKAKGSSIEEKIADFEARGVTYDMKSVIPKELKKHEDSQVEELEKEHYEPIKPFDETLTEDFLITEQNTELSLVTKSTKVATDIDQVIKDTTNITTTTAPVAEKRTSLVEKTPEPKARSTIFIGEEESADAKTKSTEIIKEIGEQIEKEGATTSTETRKITEDFLTMEQQSQEERRKTVSELATCTADLMETTAEIFETTTDLEQATKGVEDSKTHLKAASKEWIETRQTDISMLTSDLTVTAKKLEDEISTELSAKVIETKEIARETKAETVEKAESKIGDTMKELLESKELVSKISSPKEKSDGMEFVTTESEQKVFSIQPTLPLQSVEINKLTQDFLAMEQQTQLPYTMEPKAKEVEPYELLKSATHTIVPSVQSSKVVPDVSADFIDRQQEKLLGDFEEHATDVVSKEVEPHVVVQTTEAKNVMSDLIKTTSVIMATVPKVGTEEAVKSLEQSLADIQTKDKDTSSTTTTTQQTKHETPSDTTQIDFEPEIIIDEKTTTLKISSAATDTVKEESIKLVESIKKLEETIKVVDKSQADGIELAAPISDTDKVSATGIRKLTEDFLTIEQTTQFSTSTKPIKETIVTDTFGKTATLPIHEKPEEQTESVSTIGLSEEINKIVSEAATKIDAIKMTDSFLAAEQQQRTQFPIVTKSPTTNIQTVTETVQKFGDDLAAPAPIEPRKSITLTDAEFCKSVEETITKKMSAGQIEISDELKTIASDIPHSQTPPPTPIETKTDRQRAEESPPRETAVGNDNLIDTVITLHKTTESTFERVSGISKIGKR